MQPLPKIYSLLSFLVVHVANGVLVDEIFLDRLVLDDLEAGRVDVKGTALARRQSAEVRDIHGLGLYDDVGRGFVCGRSAVVERLLLERGRQKVKFRGDGLRSNDCGRHLEGYDVCVRRTK